LVSFWWGNIGLEWKVGVARILIGDHRNEGVRKKGLRESASKVEHGMSGRVE